MIMMMLIIMLLLLFLSYLPLLSPSMKAEDKNGISSVQPWQPSTVSFTAFMNLMLTETFQLYLVKFWHLQQRLGIISHDACGRHMLLLKVAVIAVNCNFLVIVVFCEVLGDGSEVR